MAPWSPPRPHPALRPYVASLVPYDVDLGPPGVHRGLPSTALTFVLPLDEPLEVSWAGDASTRTRGWSSISGLHTLPAAIHHRGHQRGVQVGLTTAGARALLGHPAGAIAGTLLEIADTSPALADLPARLAEVPRGDLAALKRLVEAALLGRLRAVDAPGPRPEVARALVRLTRGAGVAEVADEVGYSRRRLTTLVVAETGLGPKEFQRVARFVRSRDLLLGAARAGGARLAEVAAAAGYADQPHLSREWRRLAGCSPGTWLREEFPFVHDLAAEDEARWATTVTHDEKAGRHR